MTKGIRWALNRLEKEREQLDVIRAKLDAAIASLEAVNEVDEEPSGSLTGDLTVSDAIDVVLRDADRPLTVAQIRERGREQGLLLNPNSVRWSLRQATESGKYRQLPPDSGRAKLYKLAGT